MKKIITSEREFKTVIEKLNATLVASFDGSYHFYTPYGEIVEYHSPRCNEVNNPKYIKPFNATHEEINYRL